VTARAKWLPMMSAALCLPLVAAVVVLTHRTSDTTTVGAARRAALAVAPGIARDVLSYDYRTIDADIARAQAETTATFAQQYATTAAQLKSAAQTNHAIVQAQPHAPGIVSAITDNVVVLVFVDQVSVTEPAEATTPTTHAAESRVQMTLRHVNGKWLLDGLSDV